VVSGASGARAFKAPHRSLKYPMTWRRNSNIGYEEAIEEGFGVGNLLEASLGHFPGPWPGRLASRIHTDLVTEGRQGLSGLPSEIEVVIRYQ
jgi:hypothetical protein